LIDNSTGHLKNAWIKKQQSHNQELSMSFKDQTPEEKFWMDEPRQNEAIKLNGAIGNLIRTLLNITIFPFLLILLIVPSYVLAYISPILAWAWMGLIVLTVVFSFYQKRRRKLNMMKTINIQEVAREKTQATCIGSAIHVAGYPQLERDQPVVLALKDDNLSIFNYEKSTPLAVLNVIDVKSIHTVIYDDERVPHMHAIDSTAQALQITFNMDGNEWTCLFKRMLKVRPIDWYHALQQARMVPSARS
jgi:hypothetical protein